MYKLLLAMCLTATLFATPQDTLQDYKSVYNEQVSDQEDAVNAATAALSSVELNPDHEGFSLSMGLSGTGNVAGAIGAMYVIRDRNHLIGFNVKAYTSTKTVRGASFGMTVGF